MNRRQKLVQSQFLNNEEAVIKRLEKVYGVAQKDINDKIKNLQLKIDKLQLEYDWMDDDDPAKQKVKSMIQSKIYQKKYQQALGDQIDGILKQMQTKGYLTISDYLDECYEDGFVGSLFDLHGQGIPMLIPLDQTKMVDAVQLDSKISQGLYTRLGEDVGLLKKKITAQVSRSIATGISYGQTAQLLAGYTRIGYNNAIRITRTEGHRIQTTAAMNAMEQAKDRGADVVKQWDAALDARTRESHTMVDGEIRELDKPFSNGLMYPGDPDGGAAEVINCRCALLQRAKWALDDSELQTLKDRASFFGLDKANEYDDFKKKYLKAVQTPDPVSAATTAPVKAVSLQDFPEYFRKSGASKKAAQTFVDALNEAQHLPQNIRNLYTRIGDLPNIPANMQISYTGKDHALSTWYSVSTGNVTKAVLKVPKMSGDDLNGQKSTAFHEIGHLIDLGTGTGRKAKTAQFQKLSDAVQKADRAIPDEIGVLFKDFDAQYDAMRDSVRNKYADAKRALNDAFKAGTMPYSQYKKEWNAYIREEELERDYLARNLCGGGIGMLSDIYDALSGGSYRDKGVIRYGHGSKYYARAGNKESEIFANYMSLSVNRPDLVDMLRKDQPDLCAALDEMIEEMAGAIK